MGGCGVLKRRAGDRLGGSGSAQRQCAGAGSGNLVLSCCPAAPTCTKPSRSVSSWLKAVWKAAACSPLSGGKAAAAGGGLAGGMAGAGRAGLGIPAAGEGGGRCGAAAPGAPPAAPGGSRWAGSSMPRGTAMPCSRGSGTGPASPLTRRSACWSSSTPPFSWASDTSFMAV